jgi:hypothetical protein
MSLEDKMRRNAAKAAKRIAIAVRNGNGGDVHKAFERMSGPLAAMVALQSLGAEARSRDFVQRLLFVKLTDDDHAVLAELADDE